MMNFLIRTCVALSVTLSAFIHNAQSQSVLSFGGTDAYISFTNDSVLGSGTFTVECWFKRTGAGVVVATGSGGTSGVPLVTKGRGESDGNLRDMNFFLGIDTVLNVLTADFEEGTNQPIPGLNHPLNGITPIALNAWHHAAFTYDGNTSALFLDGILESTSVIGVAPQSNSIQPFCIGSALTSFNAPGGFFEGIISDVRIWNYARSSAEIHSTINGTSINPQPGLSGAWLINEGNGTTINDQLANNIQGTINGTNYSWIADSVPYNLVFNDPPSFTSVITPDSINCISFELNLSTEVNDPDTGLLTVTYYIATTANDPVKPFTIIGLPDTQHYTGEIRGGSNAILHSQIDWIVNHIDSLNIAFVEGLGDCVQLGDNNGDPVEWLRYDTCMSILEDPLSTQLIDGLPYGVNVGNHDQSPQGNPNGTTVFFNQYFGETRFMGRNYYGGHYGTNNNTNYSLFTAEGIDFVVINFQFDNSRDTAEINWAHGILNQYSNRRAIIGSHYILNLNGTYGNQGLLLYNEFKIHPNLFMMMSGHVDGESKRTDNYNGNIVHAVMSDYQSRTAGGNGWLRVYTFLPQRNQVEVRTYSPWLNKWENDSDSRFNLPYELSAPINYQNIGTVNATPGSVTQINVSALQPYTTYLWYAVVSDGVNSVTSDIHQFSTAAMPAASLGNDTSICSGCDLLLDAGTGHANYLWDDSSSASTHLINSAGNYYVQVTDSAGCISSDTVSVSVFTAINTVHSDDAVKVYPNPFKSEIKISISIAYKEISVSLTDAAGHVLLKDVKHAGSGYSQDVILNTSSLKLPSGVYTLSVTVDHVTHTFRLIKD